MAKIKIENQNFSFPMPVVVVGTEVDSKPNFMAVAWFCIVSHTPPKIAIVLGDHFTNKGIRATRSFSVCIPSEHDLGKVDYAGIVSGASSDKSTLFTVFYGELKNAPMIEECPICIECRLDCIETHGKNEMFIGDIHGVYSEARYLIDGQIDFGKVHPFVLAQGRREYWSLGEVIGTAWSDGEKYIA